MVQVDVVRSVTSEKVVIKAKFTSYLEIHKEAKH